MNRRLRRQSAQRVWRSLGKPGTFKEFWETCQDNLDARPRVKYTTSTEQVTAREGESEPEADVPPVKVSLPLRIINGVKRLFRHSA